MFVLMDIDLINENKSRKYPIYVDLSFMCPWSLFVLYVSFYFLYLFLYLFYCLVFHHLFGHGLNVYNYLFFILIFFNFNKYMRK